MLLCYCIFNLCLVIISVSALNVMYTSMNSPSQLDGWKSSGGDPCGQSWKGITCSGSKVTEMYNFFLWISLFISCTYMRKTLPKKEKRRNILHVLYIICRAARSIMDKVICLIWLCKMFAVICLTWDFLDQLAISFRDWNLLPTCEAAMLLDMGK